MTTALLAGQWDSEGRLARVPDDLATGILVTAQTRICRPLLDPPRTVAVVGAGIAGLTASRALRDHGLSVTVFEKSRGPSGRMSTRRVDGGRVQFDHGAQYFTARDPAFRRQVEGWVHDRDRRSVDRTLRHHRRGPV